MTELAVPCPHCKELNVIRTPRVWTALVIPVRCDYCFRMFKAQLTLEQVGPGPRETKDTRP